MMRSSLMSALVLATVLGTGAARGQCTLATPYLSNNGLGGVMFDLVNQSANPITLSSFDVDIDAGTFTIEVWAVTGGGTMVGKNNTPGLWTQVGNYAGVVGIGVNSNTPLPALTGTVTIPSGGTQGIYIVAATGSPFNYRTGLGTLGSVVASDCYFQLLSGYGIGYNFPAGFNSPRDFVGRVHYICPPVPSDWQVNQAPQASLDVNNVQALPCLKASTVQSVVTCAPITPATGTVRLSTNLLGMPWDIALSGAALVGASAGGITLPDGQIINLDITGPLLFLNGFLANTIPSGLPGASTFNLTFGYSLGVQTDVSMQGVLVDPSMASGIRLTQGAELHVNVVPPPTTFAGPTADNATVALNVTAAPTCWFPGGIPFFGTFYTTVHIVSNGRIMFGAAGDTDSSATVAEALLDIPFVGVWRDFNPALAPGAITASIPGPNLFRVDFSVRDAGEAAGPVNTFGIQIDVANGNVTIDGLTGVAANPQAVFSATLDSSFFGISKGNTGATNSGVATLFAAGGSGFPANASDMWYDFYTAVAGGAGRPASLAPGTLSSVTFAPDATYPTNYQWGGL